MLNEKKAQHPELFIQNSAFRIQHSLMRWQKIARLAIASFVIVFAGVVFFIMRQRTAAPPDVPVDAPSFNGGAKVVNQGPLEFELTQHGKLRYRIVGKQHRVYADDRNTIEHVEQRRKGVATASDLRFLANLTPRPRALLGRVLGDTLSRHSLPRR